jgi:hypothetical protein
MSIESASQEDVGRIAMRPYANVGSNDSKNED